nr:MAG: hypothetical protein [Podoviridae sp. ctka020]
MKLSYEDAKRLLGEFEKDVNGPHGDDCEYETHEIYQLIEAAKTVQRAEDAEIVRHWTNTQKEARRRRYGSSVNYPPTAEPMGWASEVIDSPNGNALLRFCLVSDLVPKPTASITLLRFSIFSFWCSIMFLWTNCAKVVQKVGNHYQRRL